MADPSIPLSYRPPQFDSPLQMATQALNLRNLGTQSQINQQRLQQETYQTQQMQREQQDMATVKDEFSNPAYLKPDPSSGQQTFDWDSFRSAIAPKVSYSTLQKLDNDHLEQQRAYSAQNAAAKADLAMKNQVLGPAYASLLQTPPEQRLAAAQKLLPGLIQAKALPPNYQIDPNDLTDEALNAHATAAGYMGTLATADQKRQLAAEQAAVAKQRIAQAAAATSEEAAKSKQRDREDAAREYQFVTTSPDPETAHTKWQAKWGKEFPEYAALPYSEDNQEVLDNAALTSQQRQLNYFAGIRADNSGRTRAALATKAYDPTATPEERQQALQALEAMQATGANRTLTPNAIATQQHQREVDANKDSQAFTKYKVDEQTQWGVKQKYASVVAQYDPIKDADTAITDPVTGKQITVKDAITLRDIAQNKAQAIQAAAENILKKHGWGDYAPGGPRAGEAPASETPNRTTGTLRSALGTYANGDPTKPAAYEDGFIASLKKQGIKAGPFTPITDLAANIPAVARAIAENEGDGGAKNIGTKINNPGNIEWADWGKKYGATPFKASNGHTYMQFPNLGSGWSALEDLVGRYVKAGGAPSANATATPPPTAGAGPQGAPAGALASGAAAPSPPPTGPAAPPPAATPPKKADPNQKVTVRLPNGKYLSGTRKQLEPFLNEAGLKLNDQ